MQRALAYTALIMGGAALGTAVTIGSSPILVPLIVAGTIADLGIGGINGYQCYNHFRDPCNANYSNYDCLDALLGTAGAAGGATALRGLTKVSGKVVPAGGLGDSGHSKLIPEFGRKLDYLLGRAKGKMESMQRSTQMLKELEKIGLHDSAATRELLTRHLDDVLNRSPAVLSSPGVPSPKGEGRIIFESLLMGPNGAVKVDSVWEGNRLITAVLNGGQR